MKVSLLISSTCFMVALIFIQMICWGQNKHEFNIVKDEPRALITKVFLSNRHQELYDKTPADSVYMLSVAISFDHEGKVDTVLFPKKISEHTRKVFGINHQLIDNFKNFKFSWFKFKNQIVLLPILFAQFQDKNIILSKNFLEDYQNVWPEFGSLLNGKELILLEPYVNYHGRYKYH